jgi:transaldolase
MNSFKRLAHSGVAVWLDDLSRPLLQSGDLERVNVTLIFSLDRYRAVLDAFMTGLEQRTAKRQGLGGIESVASFFVSRVDTEVDRQLRNIGEADPSLTNDLSQLSGQAALANARLAYEVYEAVRSSDRWKALAAKGAKLQRLLWASTGVKDKAFPPTRYVTELIAPDTVNTMPKATLAAVEKFDGAIADAVTNRYAESTAVVASLAKVGVDLAAVADVLERQGVASFAQSWNDLIKSVQEQLENAGADVMPAGAVTPAAQVGSSSRAPAAAAPVKTAAGGRRI